jgi:hypothetical protein
MKGTHWGVIGGVLLLVATVGVNAQQAPKEAELDPETAARVARFDKGPPKIDVSKYPAEMKANYKVFSEKCVKCHTLARAINCDYVLDDEWERYVKRMMRRAGSFISPNEGKQIFEFVTYDSKIRKKALYDKKMANPPKTPGF